MKKANKKPTVDVIKVNDTEYVFKYRTKVPKRDWTGQIRYDDQEIDILINRKTTKYQSKLRHFHEALHAIMDEVGVSLKDEAKAPSNDHDRVAMALVRFFQCPENKEFMLWLMEQ